MPTPQVHSAAARSNPRRRQRNASEDSVAIRQPVKRRKRSALTKETFAETSEKVNGSLEHVEDAPLLNGSAHEPSSMRNNKNGPSNNLAIRHGLSKKSESQWRSERSGNDIELTKNDNYIVTQLPTTPDVLSRLLKEEPWRAELSPQLGCAIAMTHVSALIWRYTQSPGSSELIEPMQIRLLDPIASPHQPLPMGVLVPTSAEPALLVLMPTTGKVTYWEALSYAANSDLSRQRQSSIQGVVGGMMSGEQIVAVTEAEPRGFVLTLNTGRLAHLAIKDTQGRLSIEVHYLRSAAAQPKGIFGSIRGVLSTAGWKKDLAAVKAGRSVRRGQRYMVVATNEGTFQVWDLHWNGTHTLAYEVDAKVDLLRESLKGVRNTQALHEYPFKVLDFSLLPHGSHGRDVAKTYTSGDCRLLVLTALKDPQVSKYTLIGLTLADGKGTVDVVHQITCYTSHIPADPQFRPQIMVPEPAQTAIIAFEKSLVLLSLVEVDETPSSQLQMEAHTLPIPFQDAVAFRQDKSCYTIACAAEALDRDRQRSICSFLIHGYGMIRISTQPTKAGQSPVSRAAITAQTKIEQAVFFGSHNQNLIDFSPRSETRFSSLDIEAASLNISQAIANSTTPYLARLEPNMQRSLTKRAAALDNLIRYLREHHSRSLSPQCRWKLLWTAEKMAAAQAIWQWYNNILSDPRTKQRDLFAELIESMPDTAKLENQPDTGESDGVRHWFVHDVWRLEWIIPYAHEIIELLFRESVEDKTQLDNLTKAHMIGDAVDIQSGTMEAAFQFRELNADLYGFDKNRISDGILRAADDFENIDEFWTSAALGADTP
ncbi:uncharacterized protein KY384_006972 [Bacidia gigantensis]|uniref:uncharacterized protein n=1 Tax=Bacidia gigantensis TaxID=2732470 RepID=UPI001D054AD7|nr:uncharacterized protein KY384_006972 [Bacidia gigantensis]KAG8528056.1 hypothetical protein KY384_006972 [Bacidia gigantensis]